MRDIQMILERYGAWATCDSNNVYYPTVAAGFKGMLPLRRSSRLSCCDDDGLILNSAMACLRRENSDLCQLLEWYYIYGLSVRQIGKHLHISHTQVLKKLQAAEGFIDGCLAMMGSRLEMDCECQLEGVFKKSDEDIVEFQKAG